MPNLRHLALTLAMATSFAACHRGPNPPPAPADMSLSGLSAQHVILLPTYLVRVPPDHEWRTAIGRPQDLRKALDSAIVLALEERGAGRSWILPSALTLSYKHNISYATDPYALAEEPLRAPNLEPGTRLAEPLASQLRTMVALHEEGRLVISPVELRFERLDGGSGRAILRLALMDARASDVRWLGEIKGDSAREYSPHLITAMASRFVDLLAYK
jgi:hypothetical protein